MVRTPPATSAHSASLSATTHYAHLRSLQPLVDSAERVREALFADAGRSERVCALAGGQQPDFMTIGCSDSRYTPTAILGLEEGRAFEMQQVGAIVPPYADNAHGRGSPAAATVGYGVHYLHVKHVLIVGHTCCGAVDGIMKGMGDQADADVAESAGDAAAQTQRDVAGFLRMAGPVRERVEQFYAGLDASQRLHAASAEATLLQREHLLQYPAVKAALKDKQQPLEVHALVLNLHTRRISIFEPAIKQYVMLGGGPSDLPQRRV